MVDATVRRGRIAPIRASIPSTEDPPRPPHMTAPHRIVDGFFPGAAALRAAFDRHLAAEPARRQAWEIVSGPGRNFLRANPVRVLPQAAVAGLVSAVQSWAALNLGLAATTLPELRLHVGGCGEEAVNGAGEGLWSWSYSLTRWDARRFAGGETLLDAPAPYWGGVRMLERATAATAIEPEFDRLVLFDDRLLAAVRPVAGGLDPAGGVLTLRGHLLGDGFALMGGLALGQVQAPLSQAVSGIASRWRSRGLWHGHVGVRITVAPDGRVAEAIALADRLVSFAPSAPASTPLVDDALAALRALRLPAADGPTRIHFAILTDGDRPPAAA